MQLTITFDERHFLVQIGSDSVKSGIVTNVESGDMIRISSNYERNFFLNSSPIGLFDENDDAMYQNIYTLVPESDVAMGKLDVSFAKNDTMGDALPYSVADAFISSPGGWRFFKSPACPFRVNIKHFRELEKIFSFGLFVSSLRMPRYRFKILDSLESYMRIKNACGVLRDGDDFLFIYQGESDNAALTFIEDDKRVLHNIRTEEYGSLDSLVDSVTTKLLKEKKGE